MLGRQSIPRNVIDELFGSPRAGQPRRADSCLLCFQHKPTQGRGIAERNQEREKQTRDDLHQAAGLGVTEEIEKLDRLKSAGAILEAEYSRLRARLVQ